MHTPDSPERARLREALREISRTLLPLHRRLIETAKSDYVFAYESNATPAQLIDLLQKDPFFAWLRPLTAVIVDIDEMARTDFEPADTEAIITRIESLLADPKYVDMLQRDVEVASSHATLRGVLQRIKS